MPVKNSSTKINGLNLDAWVYPSDLWLALSMMFTICLIVYYFYPFKAKWPWLGFSNLCETAAATSSALIGLKEASDRNGAAMLPEATFWAM